ncbi:MAG: hypothetical protein J0L77_07910 [Alphaproteobacteria bacterium]|nr:hypothetical protein [Alphaproteobacteria bacterium]
MTSTSSYKSLQSGNALIFILIAVVLLGGLTMLLTRSSGSSEDTGEIERTQIEAGEAMRFGKSLAQSAQNLIAQGCSENTLNFDYEAAVTGYENPSSPADKSCDIFDAKGAGLTWRTVPSSLSSANYLITSANTVQGVGCDTGNATCTDLILMLPGISQTACAQINRLVKVTNPANVPPADTDNLVDTSTKFTGGYAFVRALADAGGHLTGKETGCIQTSPGNFALYTVILGR